MEYIEFALSEKCQPVFVDPYDTSPLELDRSVLDPRCQDWESLLPVSNEPCGDELLLKQSLMSFFNTNHLENSHFILSLSGGVDSMSMAVLLKELGIRFVAVHIRHSSRLEDTQNELDWVKFVCRRLEIPLYYHHVLVARPHGDGDVGVIARDTFEEKTRDIRFCMYSKAFRLGFDDSTHPVQVLIGHHIDDVDENRIAELGKGNLINIDGMAETSSFADVVQLRPLCTFVRKCTLRNFALSRGIPHMRNSTPKWSRRGWIRDVLDSDERYRYFLLKPLSDLGAESSRIDQMIHQIARDWAQRDKGIQPFTYQLTLNSKAKQINIRCTRFAVDRLLDNIRNEQLVELFKSIHVHAIEFGNLWNSYFKHFARNNRDGVSCPIQAVGATEYTTESMETEILNRVFQLVFGDLKKILDTEKFVLKKSVAQLLEGICSKSAFSWKVARKDLLLVKIHAEWYILGEVEPNIKRAIFASLEKVVISDIDSQN